MVGHGPTGVIAASLLGDRNIRTLAIDRQRDVYDKPRAIAEWVDRLAPSALLESEFHLIAKRDYEPVFSGKHDNSVLGVANKDYDAAAIANEVMFRMFERNVVDKAKIRTIYKSETFPTTGYGLAHNLDPALQAKIKEAFFTFPWEGSALQAEFKGQDKFVPITYKKDWSVIRKIDAASGIKYSCK